MKLSARLIISDDIQQTSLVLQGYDLKEPVPEHPLLESSYHAFSYYGCVGVLSLHHWDGVSTTIETMPHTGRGQTKLFDKLVGPRIAALRLTMSREMRSIMKETGSCSGQELEVHFTSMDADRIRESIQTCADDENTTFFAWRNMNLGRYDVNNRLVWGRD